MEKTLHPLAMVYEIIGKERAKVLELRTKMGLHRLETDKGRWERWEITAAKLFALDAVRDALQESGHDAFSEVGHLTGKKSILTLLRKKLDFEQIESVSFLASGMPTAAKWHQAKAESIEDILSQFSGSAGTQPLTGEETPEPMGIPPVTVPALTPIPDDLCAWVSDMPTAEIQRLSEECLDELEARGVVCHWSLTGA